MLKKPAKEKVQDWHPIDLGGAVRKAGSSLCRLARQHGLHSSTVRMALYKPYPKSERIIAEFLKIPAQTIWPSRYNTDGSPKSGRGERGLGRHHSRLAKAIKAKQNNTTPDISRNVNTLNKVAA